LSLRNCRLAIIAFVLSWDPDWCQIHVDWKADESSLNFQLIQKYFLHIYQPCAKISALPWQFSAFSLRNHQGTNRLKASGLLKNSVLIGISSCGHLVLLSKVCHIEKRHSLAQRQ
jgi:hypothetical protein